MSTGKPQAERGGSVVRESGHVLIAPFMTRATWARTLAAAIRRDRLFFFGSFEYNPLGQASSSAGQIFAPTASGYTTLAATPGVNQTILR